MSVKNLLTIEALSAILTEGTSFNYMKKSKIKKAGAIILSSDFKSIALVNHPQKNDWSFPKGHVEGGENFQQAMQREVMEETGMEVKIVKKLPFMEYRNNNEDDVTVAMFLVVFQSSDSKLSKGQEKVEWFSIDEVLNKLSYKNLKEYFYLVLPEIKTLHDGLPKVAIIVSRCEHFADGAGLILEDAKQFGLLCEVIFIEDLIFDNKIAAFDLIYFLTNFSGIEKYVVHYESLVLQIINKDFLIDEKRKFYLQNKVGENGISVPASVSASDVLSWAKDRSKFPIYVKSQNQASTVIRVEDEIELSKAIAVFKCQKEDWYLEKGIEGEEIELHKIYYVNSNLVLDKNFAIDKRMFDSISKILNLSVFSSDVLVSMTGEYWVIDINPAPAFFKSQEARKHLAELIIKLLKMKP